ncbi:TioA protein, partial [Salmonella enterica subsp. enterica]|nr:TioA protein [Salmonella enterica subsp. enterica]
MKCITSNRRNKILNQKHLIYFFCLIIILFFITIKN